MNLTLKNRSLKIDYPALSPHPVSFDKPLGIVTAAELELSYRRIDAQIAGHRAEIGKPLSLRTIAYTRERCLVLWEQWQREMETDRYAGQTRGQRRLSAKHNRQQRRADEKLAREQQALFDCPPYHPIGITEKVCYGIMTTFSSGWFALAIAVVIIVVIFGGHEFPEIHEYLASHLKGLQQ